MAKVNWIMEAGGRDSLFFVISKQRKSSPFLLVISKHQWAPLETIVSINGGKRTSTCGWLREIYKKKNNNNVKSKIMQYSLMYLMYLGYYIGKPYGIAKKKKKSIEYLSKKDRFAAILHYLPARCTLVCYFTFLSLSVCNCKGKIQKLISWIFWKT